MRFERNVHRRTANVFGCFARRAQRFRFRVRLARDMVPALAERAVTGDDDRADGRIRRRITDAARRQFDGACEVRGVGRSYG